MNELAPCTTSAGTLKKMHLCFGFGLVQRWVGGLARSEHWRASYSRGTVTYCGGALKMLVEDLLRRGHEE